jgi:hypothetical protein
LPLIQIFYQLYRIPYHLKIPVVAFSSVGANLLTNEMTKNPVNPAYNPSILLGLGDKMNFYERFQNTAVTLAELFYYQ